MQEEMIFDDLTPQEVPVAIGKDRHVLVEPSEAVAIQYRNAAMRAAKFSDGKMSGIDGAADVQALLVSLCLFRVEADGQKKAVDVKTVKGWPARVVKALFDRAKKMGALDEKPSEEAEKNSSGGGAGTSASPTS